VVSDFERYRPAMGVFFTAPLFMALIFGGVVLQGGSPVRPEFYGPIVYEVDAMAWVALQAGLSGAAALGCALGWPRIAAVAAAGLSAVFEFFAAAAIVAGASGTLLVAMAIPTGALAFLCAAICWRGRHGKSG
jgi:hypothetical protein